MPAPKMEFYADGGGALSTPISVSAVSGTPGTAFKLELWNDKGGGSGSDDAINRRVQALFRDDGDIPFLASGHEFADGHFLEMRILNGINISPPIAQSGWYPVGASSRLPLPVIGSDEGLDLELRINAPPSYQPPNPVGSNDVDFVLKVQGSNAEPTAPGLTLSGGDGIFLGLRRSDYDELVLGGAVVENPAGADDDVEVATVVTLGDGIPRSEFKQLVTVADATSGNERFDLISMSAAGVLTLTAGTEVTAPATDADKPAVPDQHVGLAYVLAKFALNRLDADITDIRQPALYEFSSSAAQATIARGPKAVVDDALLTHQRSTVVALTTSSDNWIWLTRSGLFAVTTTAAPPEPEAMLLHEATVDGVPVVTSQTDRRRFVGHALDVIRFNWLGSLAATGDFRYATVPGFRKAIIIPLRGVILSQITAAAGGTPVGETRADIEYWDGSVWTSIFDTAEDRPAIGATAGANQVDLGAVPAEFELESGAILRANLAALPTGQTTDPLDAQLLLAIAQ